MDKYHWKSEFATGIAEIDREHRQLFDILNDCQASPVQCQHHYDDLKTYAEEHFAREEALMEATGYPETDAHRLTHQFFRERIAEQEQAVADGDWQAVVGLVAFLRSWFLEHILDEDRRYARFIDTTLSQTERDALMKDGAAAPDA